MASRALVTGLLVALAAPVAGYLVGRRAGEEPPDLSAVAAPLEAAAREQGLEAALLKAVVASESSGRRDAVSAAGALGLTQLLLPTAVEQAERLGLPPPTREALLSDAQLNLRLGAAYLAQLLRRFDGDEAFALAAYNAGPSHVLRWRFRAVDAAPRAVVRREAFPATRAYVERVLALRDRYR